LRAGLILVASLLLARSVLAEALPIPDPATYARFLVGGTWKPDRPSVLVFKDPRCPYCVAAIPRLGALAEYNVFLFWAPILGPESVARVDEIFRCSAPAAPDVLEAVAAKRAPACEGAHDDATAALNAAMVSAYDIQSVPAYALQGTFVSEAYLVASRRRYPPVQGVVVDWARYRPQEVRGRTEARTLALIVPSRFVSEVERLDREQRPQFVFAPGAQADELKLLLGLNADERPDAPLVVEWSGALHRLSL